MHTPEARTVNLGRTKRLARHDAFEHAALRTRARQAPVAERPRRNDAKRFRSAAAPCGPARRVGPELTSGQLPPGRRKRSKDLFLPDPPGADFVLCCFSEARSSFLRKNEQGSGTAYGAKKKTYRRAAYPKSALARGARTFSAKLTPWLEEFVHLRYLSDTGRVKKTL